MHCLVLSGTIFCDLGSCHSACSFALLTAVTVVTTAHHTRLLTAQREQLVLERDALDIEWRNLILEENALGDHSRVERIATEKLQMQHVDPSQENIVVQK